MKPHIEMRYESASLVLSAHPKKPRVYMLHNLYSTKPRQGHASALMTQAMEVADREQLVIFLTPRQYGNPYGMSTKQLIEWYKRFGFVENGKGMMVRSPSHEIQGI